TTQGIITNWNPGAARMFGYPAEEMVGQPVSLLNPPEQPHGEPEIRDRLEQGTPVQNFETVRVRKDGKLIQGSLTVSPLRDATGTMTGTSTIARDISQRRILEEQLRQAHKMEAVGHLAGGVAHDFNNLLTVINGFSEVVLGNVPRTDPSHQLIVEIR